MKNHSEMKLQQILDKIQSAQTNKIKNHHLGTFHKPATLVDHQEGSREIQ